ARLPGGRAELDAAATLAGDALALERLDAAVLGGMLHSRGGVDLGARSGYASIDFADLAPSLLDARLAGRLGGRVAVAAPGQHAAAPLAGDALALGRPAAAVLGGMRHSRGGVDLGARSGYASIDFAGLEPSLLDARLAGVLGGRVDVAAASEPALRVSVVGDVAGRLGERPLEGSVQGSYANGGLHIARAEVTLDDGRLSLAGALTREAADLSLVVQVPELGYWYPPASG